MRNGLSYSEAGKLGADKSRATIQKMTQERIDTYNKNPKLCKYCQKPLTYEQNKLKNRYCSSSCSCKNSSRGVSRKRKCFNPDLIDKERIEILEKMGYIAAKEKKCIGCGVDLNVLSGSKKYCSHKCQHKIQWEKIREKIISGKYTSKHSGSWALDKFLTEERGRKCEECNMETWRGKPIPLNVHHIDGDAGNNVPNNLKLLCLNCHGITDNYGSKNKSCTRDYRRKSKM